MGYFKPTGVANRTLFLCCDFYFCEGHSLLLVPPTHSYSVHKTAESECGLVVLLELPEVQSINHFLKGVLQPQRKTLVGSLVPVMGAAAAAVLPVQVLTNLVQISQRTKTRGPRYQFQSKRLTERPPSKGVKLAIHFQSAVFISVKNLTKTCQ